MQMQMQLDECIACRFRLSLLQPAYVVHTNRRREQQHSAVDKYILTSLITIHNTIVIQCIKLKIRQPEYFRGFASRMNRRLSKKWWGRGEMVSPKVPSRPGWPYLYLSTYFTLYGESWVGTRYVFLDTRTRLLEDLTLVMTWRELSAKCDLSSPSA